MKIVLISYSSPFAAVGFSPGFERLVGNLVECFIHLRHEVDVFTSYWPKPLIHLRQLCPRQTAENSLDRLNVSRVPNSWTGVFSSNLVTFNIALRKYMLRIKEADIIQVMQEGSFIPLRSIDGDLPPVCSYFAHTEPLRWDLTNLTNEPTYRPLKRLQYSRSDIVMVSVPRSSPEFKAFLLDYQVPLSKVRFVTEGVDVNFFKPIDTREPSSSFDCDALYVGSLHPRKGLRHLIYAWKIVSKELPRAILRIIGRGYWFEKLSKLVRKLDLDKNVIFNGRVSDKDLPSYYRASKIYAYPSIVDGWPLTPMEAMACGTPVVGSNTAAMREIIGCSGILCDPRNQVAFGQAIISLLLNEDRRKKMAKEAVERVRKRFAWERISQFYINVYKELV